MELNADQVEFADFLLKMDYEGGLEGMIHWGGWKAWPPALQEQAKKLDTIISETDKAIRLYAETLGFESVDAARESSEWY